MVHKIRRLIEKIASGMAIALLLMLVVLAFIQVILRNLFSIGLNLVEESMRNGVLWIGFIGALLTTLRAKHISIDILPRIVQGRSRRVLDWILAICSSVICLVLGFYSMKFVQLEIETGAQIGGAIPAWTFEIILPLGFLLLAIAFILSIVRLVALPEESKSETVSSEAGGTDPFD